MSTTPSVFSVKCPVEAFHFSPQKRFSLLAITSDLYRPISDWEKGCLTQLVEEMRSPSTKMTLRPGCPSARRDWLMYGKPPASALPVPPQPTTATRVREHL